MSVPAPAPDAPSGVDPEGAFGAAVDGVETRCRVVVALLAFASRFLAVGTR